MASAHMELPLKPPRSQVHNGVNDSRSQVHSGVVSGLKGVGTAISLKLLLDPSWPIGGCNVRNPQPDLDRQALYGRWLDMYGKLRLTPPYRQNIIDLATTHLAAKAVLQEYGPLRFFKSPEGPDVEANYAQSVGLIWRATPNNIGVELESICDTFL